jgi:hypothetical protein
VVVTESVAPDLVSSFEHRQRGLVLASDEQVGRGAIEQPRGLDRNHVEGGIAVGRGQHVRQ